MPGIAGLISSLPDKPSRERLDLMVRPLLHEDFYSHGTFHVPDMAVHAGWTSLKGSFNDCMPIRNETGEIILFLAGEVFPDAREISGLREKGIRSRKETRDTWFIFMRKQATVFSAP
jgi:asparagine synthase (glutamine-hydrolysing)